MDKADRPDFAAAITALGEYYSPKNPISAGVIGLYWQGLAEYDLAEVQRAMQLHMQNPDAGQFMPKIADLVKLIEGSGSDKAAIAWSKVHHAVKAIGPYQTIVFDDPVIHRVLEDMGGFHPLCDMNSSDAPFRARDFENRYRAYVARREVPEYSPKIIGIVEADCRARGYLEQIPAPIFVGDRARAAQVLADGRGSGQGIQHSLENVFAIGRRPAA